MQHAEGVAGAVPQGQDHVARMQLFATFEYHAGQLLALADQDLVRRTGLDELVQHLTAVMLRVLDLAVQLAVGEGAGTAFAKLHVGLGVEYALAPQAPGVLGALAHLLAAFEDDRLEA
uniref:TetR_C_1 domain-containing protein n=1 Tax=Steinernema glaseri TaxID=37863 RepID=A0A1I7ZAM4_9BILA